MDTAARDSRFLDAEAFLRTDQSEFGGAWRYELVHGTIVAHAVPSPEHGVILGNLARELGNRLREHPECRPEIGSVNIVIPLPALYERVPLEDA